MKNKILLIAAVVVLLFHISNAQTKSQTDMFDQLKAMDSQVFDEGFNKCDLKKLEAAIADDIEFIHDKTGVQDRAGFLKSFKENVCANAEFKLKRKLIEGSLKVFPLFNGDKLYGAIQTGEHRFYVSESGKEPVLTGDAKFTHVWFVEDGKWKLKRVLSYDHQPAADNE